MKPKLISPKFSTPFHSCIGNFPDRTADSQTLSLSNFKLTKVLTIEYGECSQRGGTGPKKQPIPPMKRRLAVELRSKTSEYETFRPLGAGGEADGTATCQGLLSSRPGFETANLRLSAKISRGLRDFHAQLVSLTLKIR
jgi:hypothetical protein